jgi:AAA15 family ATPase/GTPase
LHIKNFRCFEDLTIPSLGRVNLIVGKNNSGKSTLLEAVNLYAMSKHSEQETVQEIINTLALRSELYVGSVASRRLEQFKTIFHQSSSITDTIYIGQYQKSFIEIKIEETDDAIGFRINTERNIHGEFFQIGKIIRNPIENYFKNISENTESLRFRFFSCFMNLLKTKKVKIPEKFRHYLRTTICKEDVLASFYDIVRGKTKRNEILEKLTILDKNIKDIYTKDRGDGERIFMVETSQFNKPIPLKSMGEGMTRLLQIFLHIYQHKDEDESEVAYLMIDEFENGLHYSIQEEVWEKLFKLAKELDIQVFATTHSEDTIKAFCKVALADEEIDGKIISLGRSAYGEDKGKITAIIHGEPHDLQYILDTGMEVR